MLADKTAVACLAVKDMAAAQKFYEDTLGLVRQKGDEQMGYLYKAGGSHVFVYLSQYAGTNKATAVTFGVGEDLQVIIDDLKTKGVKFEHYDMPDTTVEGDVHVMGDMRTAWFKDPDGNILNLVNQM